MHHELARVKANRPWTEEHEEETGMVDSNDDAAFDSVIEILTLTLKPGTRDRFQHVYMTEALPLLRKWRFNVLAHGPSRHDENSYYVVRAFQNLEHRDEAERAYYGSDDWRNGPRAAILAMIAHEAYTVVPARSLKEWVDSLAAIPR